MAKIIVAFFLVATMSACSMLPVRTKYVEVDHPVATCPPTQIPPRPKLDIFNLTDKSTDGEVARAYELSIKEMQGHIALLEKLLNRYNDLSKQLKSQNTTKTP